jgi:hypothetical protein
MNIQCPICGIEVRQEPRFTKKRKGAYIMLECPRNPKHFRGFIHDCNLGNLQPSLSHRERDLQYQLAEARAIHQVFLDCLTPEEKAIINGRMRVETNRINLHLAELERKAGELGQ